MTYGRFRKREKGVQDLIPDILLKFQKRPL